MIERQLEAPDFRLATYGTLAPVRINNNQVAHFLLVVDHPDNITTEANLEVEEAAIISSPKECQTLCLIQASKCRVRMTGEIISHTRLCQEVNCQLHRRKIVSLIVFRI